MRQIQLFAAKWYRQLNSKNNTFSVKVANQILTKNSQLRIGGSYVMQHASKTYEIQIILSSNLPETVQKLVDKKLMPFIGAHDLCFCVYLLHTESIEWHLEDQARVRRIF